ncbi:MAG: hypothetical protein JRI22_20985 [Deltaproteobacteria bacterium]|nr:hypothetical protein [Deltaproteobacteria bacterium]
MGWGYVSFHPETQKFILNSYGKKLKMDKIACNINNLYYKKPFSPHMKKEKVEFPDEHYVSIHRAVDG